jgi:plasmid stabilization system protein ParE
MNESYGLARVGLDFGPLRQSAGPGHPGCQRRHLEQRGEGRCRRCLPAPPAPRGIAARRTPRRLDAVLSALCKEPSHSRMRHPLHPAVQSSPIDPALSPSTSPELQILALSMAARRQDWQFAAALVFFHASEYVLAVAFHGRRNVTATCK